MAYTPASVGCTACGGKIADRRTFLGRHADDMSRLAKSIYHVHGGVVVEDGDVELFVDLCAAAGRWKAAPAQLFTRIFLDAISPPIIVSVSCTSHLIPDPGCCFRNFCL